MLLFGFGFEIQDVFRVAFGIFLGLLTVYRRELSSNRSYHNDDDTLAESAHYRLSQETEPSQQDRNNREGSDSCPSKVIRRRASSAALSSMATFDHDEQQHNQFIDDFSKAGKKDDDPTEELLESAGLFLSGGPFLYMAIAVYDHLILTTFIRTFTSAKLRAIGVIGHEWPAPPRQELDEWTLEQMRIAESMKDGSTESTQQNEQHLYSVAWNAATEYFTGIRAASSKNYCSEEHHDNSSLSRRSKSTGNLQQNLSDKHTRALFLDMLSMANNGSMDITLLPADAQINIFSFLAPKDVLSFTCSNRAGRNLLEDEVDDGLGEVAIPNENTDDSIHVKNGDTAILIWKVMFERDYSWILKDWDVGREAFLRSMEHDVLHQPQYHQQQQHSPKASKVFHHLASILLNAKDALESPIDSIIASSASAPPTSSMKEFYFKFNETWLNYTIAGCNSTEKCLIGLHGHVCDISNFVEDHPGSTETLLLQSGRDATVFFESMGHSLGARKMAMKMCVVVNGQCCRSDFTEIHHGTFRKAGPIGDWHHTWGLSKLSCPSLNIKREIPGFLLPRRRSMPRHRGGLYRIRQQMKEEGELQLADAARWGNESIGPNGMFGGVQVYYDPFRGWRWWYTDRDFQSVFTVPPS